MFPGYAKPTWHSKCHHVLTRVVRLLELVVHTFVLALLYFTCAHKAYHVLDELLIGGELQEPSKKAILRVTAAQDALMGDPNDTDTKYEL